MFNDAAQPALDGHMVQHARPNLQPASETTGVTEPWRVRKPGVDGIITRYEYFDDRHPL